MNVPNKFAAIALLCWLVGCQAKKEATQQAAGQPNEVRQEQALSELEAPAANDAKQADLVEAAPPEASKQPARQFIRTADVKFKVENVAKATDRIEAITAQQGGFVTYTKLSSENEGTETVAVSADSLLETTRYTVSNTMTLRVPNTRLDTTLRAFAGLAEYVDYRVIESDDVALQRLAATQVRRRNAAHDQRLRRAIDGRGRKLGETTNAEESRLNRQEQTDAATVNDLSLADQIQFSTVSLNLYQRQAVRRVLLPNVNDVRKYEPGFLTKAADALASGADWLGTFVLFLLNSWGIIAFCVAGYVAYRYVRARLKLGV